MNPYLQLVSKEFTLEKNQEPPHLVLAAFIDKEVYLQPEAAKEYSVPVLLHNLQEIKRVIPSTTKVMAVVKVDAYGCDAKLVARTLERDGVDFFEVATIEEDIELRYNGFESAYLF